MSAATAEVLLEVEGGVATLTLNDTARRNVMTPELGDALSARVAELKLRDDVRAVVLTGAGGAFSAGGDLKMLERLRQVSFEDARTFMLGFYARYLSVLDLPVPVIAAVDGPAIGAGLCVALACDLCLVAEDSKLALNFVQLGLHPGMGATYLAPRRAGAQAGAELLLTGRRFGGKEAVKLGLALEAAPAGQVLARARELAGQIAANAPLAVRALKTRLGLDRAALHRALEEEARFQAQSYGSEDLGEGLAAAASRRVPRFKGR
ncbi:enoyl-CoA hydratase/isomerase family protein [Corallococcus macrosporus]|uniref:Enoyl-CoA hydratase/isomerase family protein n=1 Tax=Myxococcus fulvus (strain ATCC BAA-855 / HW-1) TaxID=483219 RepID=F8CAE9_MYXFH|nr:enoyl-CoA hydratase/isomerase family protein [Corallococcus macrosporus]AEI64606.1 enoyl-CoA hydratase/isomerase family protein [Corallococcus macrosporus]